MAKPRVRTREERRLSGRALRGQCPRALHGKVILGQGDERDIVELIEASNEDRLDNLIPIRHGRMLQSAFAFFRGTAAIQAHDLAGTPSSGVIVQACGDCHLVNFGGFATPERNIIFDISDFDETHQAPFEWDLKRLAASFVVAARWRGFKADQARETAIEAVASYRRAMRANAGRGVLEGWYARITLEDIPALAGDEAGLRARFDKKVAKARMQTHERVFDKLTAPGPDGLPRIADQPPLLYHSPEVTGKVAGAFFKAYRETLAEERRLLFDRFTYVDTVLKVVGVGSVGTRCLVSLFLAAPDDPLFLQIKEARRSVLEPYLGRAKIAHHGQRIVAGQRLLQSASDIFLGWANGPGGGRDFYVRQLRDMKAAPEVETQTPRLMRGHATVCGMALARAHAKAGDAAKIAGYLGGSDKFDRAVGDYAVAYADQVERDYAAFTNAVSNGRLKGDLGEDELATALA